MSYFHVLKSVFCYQHASSLASSFSETKSSRSSLHSNLNFSECTFSLPEISTSRIFHHVTLPAKLSLFFMILFNAMLLHQPIQNGLIFYILTDFTLFLLVCLKMTFYIKQHKNLLLFLFYFLILFIYLFF